MDLNSEEEILDTENVIEVEADIEQITSIDDNIVYDENDENEEDCIDIEEESVIVDDKEKLLIIDSTKRISKNKMTRYEFVRIIGERTKQLTMGAKPLIKQSKQSAELNYNEIALEELKNNMIPFKIRRPLKNHYEIWAIEELDKRHLEHLFI